MGLAAERGGARVEAVRNWSWGDGRWGRRGRGRVHTWNFDDFLSTAVVNCSRTEISNVRVSGTSGVPKTRYLFRYFDDLEDTKLAIAGLRSQLTYRWSTTSTDLVADERSTLLSAFQAHLEFLRNQIQHLFRAWRALHVPHETVSEAIDWFLVHGCHPPAPALAFSPRMLNRRICAA